MAGIERTKQSNVYGHTMRESVAINTAIFSTLQCLRSIKQNFSLPSSIDYKTTPKRFHTRDHQTKDELENKCPNKNSNSSLNNEIDLNDKKSNRDKLLPFRKNKLTMLLQPLFSGKIDGCPTLEKTMETQSLMGNKSSTTVTLLVSVYPGKKDQHEKKFLLSEIDKIRGLKLTGHYGSHVSNFDSSKKRQGRISFKSEIYLHSQKIDPMRSSSGKFKDSYKRIPKQVTTEKNQKKLSTQNSLDNSAVNFEKDFDIKHYCSKISQLESQMSKMKKEKLDLEKKYLLLEKENDTLRTKFQELENGSNLKRKHCETCSCHKEGNNTSRKRPFSQLIPDILVKHIKDVEKSHSLYGSIYPKGEQACRTLRFEISDQNNEIRPENDASTLELLEELEKHVK